MQVDLAIDVARDAMFQALVLAGPLLFVALAVGTVVGVLQAITQVQDATISLVPKIIGVLCAAAILLPYLIEHLLEFSERLFGTLPSFLFGG